MRLRDTGGTANGGQNLSAAQTFVINVMTVNDRPTISQIADVVINENQFTELLSFTVDDEETPADELQVSAGSSNPRLVPADRIILGGGGQNRTIRVTPAADESGSATITVIVTDAEGGTASESFTLTVNARNTQPVAFAQSVGTQRNIPLDFTLSGHDGDPDFTQVLSFSRVPGSGPVHGQITAFNALTGAVTYVPDPGYVGEDSFQFMVTDDDSISPGPMTSQPATVTITVSQFNRPPVLRPIDDPEIDEGGTVLFRAVADDPDPGDRVSYALQWYGRNGAQPVPPPSNLYFNSTTGIFIWTPGEADGPGEHRAVIRAIDDAGEPLEDSQAIMIEVKEVNLRPKIIGPGYNSWVWPKAPYVIFDDDRQGPLTVGIAVDYSDQDIYEQELTIEFPGNPPGVSFDPNTKTVSVQVPVEKAVSTFDVTIAVRDSAGDFALDGDPDHGHVLWSQS